MPTSTGGDPISSWLDSRAWGPGLALPPDLPRLRGGDLRRGGVCVPWVGPTPAAGEGAATATAG